MPLTKSLVLGLASAVSDAVLLSDLTRTGRELYVKQPPITRHLSYCVICIYFFIRLYSVLASGSRTHGTDENQ
jgi:hypothetical protein